MKQRVILSYLKTVLDFPPFLNCRFDFEDLRKVLGVIPMTDWAQWAESTDLARSDVSFKYPVAFS